MNEKHAEEELDHKNLREITKKYYSDHRKHKYELTNNPKKQPNRVFVKEKLILKVIGDCGTPAVHKFRTKLGFKQYDVILTKE